MGIKLIMRKKKSDSENCKLQDENKDNVSTTGPKDCSEIKADKVDKKECLDVQFVEIANNECSKIIDTPKTISLSDLSVLRMLKRKKIMKILYPLKVLQILVNDCIQRLISYLKIIF